jgi:organic hydroperoxide reductase OsmC/OhrA
MIQYPLKFSVRSESPSGIQSRWSTESQDAGKITCAIPESFGGPGKGASPEDFFAFAVANCFIATFKVIAEKSKLEYQSLTIDSELTVDRDAQGAPWMASQHLVVTLQSPSDRERAERILTKTSQSCIVLNSIKTTKTFEWRFS